MESARFKWKTVLLDHIIWQLQIWAFQPARKFLAPVYEDVSFLLFLKKYLFLEGCLWMSGKQLHPSVFWKLFFSQFLVLQFSTLESRLNLDIWYRVGRNLKPSYRQPCRVCLQCPYKVSVKSLSLQWHLHFTFISKEWLGSCLLVLLWNSIESFSTIVTCLLGNIASAFIIHASSLRPMLASWLFQSWNWTVLLIQIFMFGKAFTSLQCIFNTATIWVYMPEMEWPACCFIILFTDYPVDKILG